MRLFSALRSYVLLGVLVFSFTGVTLTAQEAGQIKLPATPKASVLQAWNETGDQLLTMANDWPEDKYDWKLTPDVRSFKQVLLHVAGSNYDLVNRLAGSKLGDGANDPDPSKYKTKADVVKFLTASIKDGAAQIQKSSDADVLKYLYLWIGYTEHMGEHYGLLVAYYRANNMVPPSSRKK
jgi:uncharacterized damage-inducible protein DinB